MQLRGVDLPLIVYAGHADLWLMFFVAGIYLRTADREYRLLIPLIVVIALFVLQIVEAGYLRSIGGDGMGIKLSSFLFSLAVIFLLFSKKLEMLYSERYRIVRWIRMAGNLSFGMYLIHIFVLRFVRLLSLDLWIADWLLCTILTFALVYAGSHVFSDKVKQLIGFRT